MKITKKEISSLLGCFALMLIIAIPSIKMVIINTDLLNFIPLLLILFMIILNYPDTIAKKKLINLMPFYIFFFILFFSILINPSALKNISYLIKYILLAIYTILFPILIKDKSISIGLNLLMIWCAIISICQIVRGIPLNEFHYLHVGLPIGVLILIGFSNIFYSKSKIKILVNIFWIILGYMSLFTLFGRSPIIFSFLLIILVLILKSFLENSFKTKLFYSLSIAIIAVIAIWTINNYIPQYLIDRFLRISSNIAEEPRMNAVYIPAIRAIVSNPLGYGLGSSWEVIGFYPHNIFLEVTLETGIIGLMSFMIITIIFLVSCFYFLKRFNGFKTNYLALVLIALYHFLFWNVSHDLSSAYGLLPLMSIVYFKYLEKKKIEIII